MAAGPDDDAVGRKLPGQLGDAGRHRRLDEVRLGHEAPLACPRGRRAELLLPRVPRPLDVARDEGLGPRRRRVRQALDAVGPVQLRAEALSPLEGHLAGVMRLLREIRRDQQSLRQ
jgi:hypothetical protein